MTMRCAARAAALFLLAVASPSGAEDVTLTSRDGKTEISGTLLGFDGEFYRLLTLYGELTVDGSGVTCDGPGCPSMEDFVARISVSGSASMGAVLVPALLEAFAERNGYTVRRDVHDEAHFSYELGHASSGKRAAVFSFRITTSDEGFADLLANEADMVMSLREVTVEENRLAYQAGLGDLTARNRARVLALDAIVPIVSPQNPVQDISPRDLARVFSGEIDNWLALGGPDVPIVPHAPSADTGLGQAVATKVLGPAGLRISDTVSRHERGQHVTEAVVADPFAVGLSSFAETGDAQPLILKGACGRVLRATRRSIKTEDYPLTAPMFLYTPARRLPKVARDFLVFTRSIAAQVIIRRAGFVDQASEEIPVSQQGDRFVNAIASAGAEVSLAELQRMADRLGPMKRLTVSFRFEAGSASLDAQSRSNIVQLARDIEQGHFDARTVFFVGFSDGQGPAERNRQIALTRAEAVRDAVLQAAETVDVSQLNLRVDAFGEALPLACDDSAWGRKANRRVEVWVR